MVDTFASNRNGLESPAYETFLITPGGGPFAKTTRGFHVNTGGTVTVLFEGDAVARVITVVAGGWLPYRIKDCTAATGAVIIGFL